jgi:hypothetical protein
MTTENQLLRRAVRLMFEVRCQGTGCYADTGHRAGCLRGRAEKLAAQIAVEFDLYPERGFMARARSMGVLPTAREKRRVAALYAADAAAKAGIDAINRPLAPRTGKRVGGHL